MPASMLLPVVPHRARRFDGAVWKAVNFIFKEKCVLLRCLRELGAPQGTETCSASASMPEDLRAYREGFKTLVAAPATAGLAEAA